MTKKTGLGKGLDALLINNVVEEEKVHEGEVVQKLKLIEVEPNRDQPRRNFDEEAIEDLSNSIKEYGVIQPIIVTKQDNYYKIVAGERRWRASKKAGLIEIPAIVRDYDEQRNNEIALIENIQREDLNPIEKATAIRELLDKYNLIDPLVLNFSNNSLYSEVFIAFSISFEVINSSVALFLLIVSSIAAICNFENIGSIILISFDCFIFST